MSGKGYDPSSWAKQRQAAIARAQAIRAERNKGEDITEEHTFTPNTTPYPTYLKKPSSNRVAASATANGDSLDQLAMQMPSPPRHLHTQHGPGAQISAVHNPHSPNDALSKHLKSMSLQELADANPDDLDADNGGQDEAHAAFASLLRSDDPMPSKARTQRVRTKPDWNTSTEPSGWGTDTYVRPSASAQPAPAAPRLTQTTKPKTEHQDIRQARSRLSLLKSKMARQSSEENVMGDQTRRQPPQSQTPFVDSSVFIDFDANAPAAAGSSAPPPRARRMPGEQVARPPRQPAASKQADAVMPSSTWDEMPPPPRSAGRRPALQGSTAGMNQPEEYPAAQATEGMNECPDCGRKFNAESFQKHVKICQKVFMSKRKVFDTQKMRVADTEAAKFVAQANRRNPRGGVAAAMRPPAIPAASKRQQAPPPDERPLGGTSKESKWRQQSEQFREAIRQARMYQQAKDQGLPTSALPPPAPSAPDPSLIPCPHCGRRFNENAAERHIPKCQNIKAKPSRLVRGGGVNAASGRPAAEAKAAKRR